MKTNKFCQSCGMPMNSDPQKGGTEKDGTKNDKYCSYCYQNGKFTSPEIDRYSTKNANFLYRKNERTGNAKNHSMDIYSWDSKT